MEEMMLFSEQFSDQDSGVIEYNGKKINAFYSFDRKGVHILRFTFISTNSPYEQGIILHLEDFKGKLSLDGKIIKKPRGRFPTVLFDQKSAPKQFDLQVELIKGDIGICNASDPIGTGEIWHSMSLGCAMIIEELGEDHFRFHCNDHENDDDFDDLIFEMEILETQ